jgi:hypothetical protein
MGNGIITALPDKIDKHQCQSLLGSAFDENVWNQLSMNHGYITKEQFQAITARTDVFLTHDWGSDGQNHAFVSKINALLKRKGLITWFDDEKMQVELKFCNFKTTGIIPYFLVLFHESIYESIIDR